MMADVEVRAGARTRAIAQGVRTAADESRSEVPLICFTLFAPAAAGVALFSLVLDACGVLPVGARCAFAATAFALVSAGMLASIAHLARPWRAPRSLANWRRSWLSREIIAVSAFWALALLWLGAALWSGAPQHASAALNVCAAVAGALLLVVIARAYCVHGQPAWDGTDTLVELVGGALGAGSAAAAAAAGVLCSDAAAIAACALLAFCGMAASAAVLGLAWRHRLRRVADLAMREDAPRVRAACGKVAACASLPRAYRALSGAAAFCTLVVLATAVAGGDPVGDVFQAMLPACAALLVVAAACELMALASVRSRFYSLAVQDKFAVRLRR